MPAPYLGRLASMRSPSAPPPGVPDRPSLWVRLRVRWQRRELDAALAGGANPVTTEELALRADQLSEPATRARIAAGIENLFRLATDGPGPGATTAMVVASFDPHRVAANRARLAALAERLRGPEPHDVRGLAMASVLLEDGDGPLYARTTVDELEPAVSRTMAALGPASEMNAAQPITAGAVGSSA
jgi:hypothetical protein